MGRILILVFLWRDIIYPVAEKSNTYYYHIVYHQYTASNISYHLTEANLIDPIEELPLVAATKAAEASDGDTTESGLVQDDNNYIGIDWNKVPRY